MQKTGKLPPMISPSMAKGVSAYRRETLEQEVEQGLFRDGNGGGNAGGLSPASYAVASSTPIRKNADAQIGGSGLGFGGGGNNTVRQLDAIYSPLWLSSNMNLPRDRASVNAWCRSFFALQPFVHNAINLHSTYPLARLNIKCVNRKVEKFFNEMIEELDLMNICSQVAQEYWLLGEAFVYAELDDRVGKWSRLVIENPDYIVVKRSAIASEPLIMLRPDENLRKIVFSNRPADIQQRSQLNETIVEHIKRGENIPLDNFYISHLARRMSPYETRGTSLVVPCFRQLMLFDLMRESKFEQANSMINPMTLVKLGSAGEYKPNPQDLEAWRETLMQSQGDRNFKIITHDAVSIERIGWNQGIYDISGDITQLLKEIFMGLMVPEVILTGGGDISYNNGGVSLEVLRQRYMQFRNYMSSWLKNKIFAPISKINDFYDYSDGEKKLIVPEIEWSHMSIFDTMDYVNVLTQMNGGEQKKVSQHTLYRSLGLEYDEERRKIRMEDVADAIRKKELASLEATPLNELRALGPDDDIAEVLPVANQTESPYSGAGQAAPDAGGGMGMPPPLPGAPGGDMGASLPPMPGGPPPGAGGGGAPPPPAPPP